VKITGMNPEEVATLEPDVARRAYYNQATWRRVAVIVAGPGVNVLIAFVLFWAILLSGNPHGAITLSNLDESPRAVVPSTTVEEVERGAPASGALRKGDRIVAVDGRAATVESTMAAISSHRCAGAQRQGCRAATPVAVTVRRGDRDVLLKLYPRYDATARRMLIGFVFGVKAKHFGVAGAAGNAIAVMWDTTTGTLTHFFDALTESKARSEVSSIVGISRTAHQTINEGAGRALVFLGYISLILAVINMFPFLPLDGGHVLWALAEKVRGRRVSLMAMYRYSSVGIILLLFLVLNGVSNDIGRLGG